MRIITWNCNLSLSRKLHRILDLAPDIAIFQECEKDLKGIPDGWEYIWFGHNPKKGIGILSSNSKIELDSNFDETWTYFLPINVNNGNLKLLATWAYNHRADRFGDDKTGMALGVLEKLKEWMSSGSIIMVGDFNNSVVWDKPNGNNNFKDIASTLYGLDMVSAYHSDRNEEYGAESKATFFHTKKRNKPFCIDHVFCHSSLNVKNVVIGDYDEWIKDSDHVPVIVDIGNI